MRVEKTGAALGIITSAAIARFRQSSSDHPKKSSKLSRGCRGFLGLGTNIGVSFGVGTQC